MSVTEFSERARRRGYSLSADEAAAFYEQLKRSARQQRKFNAGDETLRTTVIVNEVWLKLFNGRSQRAFESQNHFLACAALAMRHIVIDKLRARQRRSKVIDEADTGVERVGSDPSSETTLMAVHESLDQLSQNNSRAAQVVECRFFAGYTERETADLLGISERTVRRDWQQAQHWLREQLQETD